MPRAKGTPKTGGRKQGTPNRDVEPLKARIRELLYAYLHISDGYQGEKEFPGIVADLIAADPETRLSLMSKLIEYVLPKLKAEAITASVNSDDEALGELLAAFGKI